MNATPGLPALVNQGPPQKRPKKHFQERSAEPQIPRLRSPVDFLLRFIALMHFMRTFFTGKAHARCFPVLRVAGNPGRDDKGKGGSSIRNPFQGSQVSRETWGTLRFVFRSSLSI